MTRRKFIAISSLATTTTAGFGSPKAAASLDTRLEAANRMILDQTRSGEVAAASLLVRQGATDFTRAYGSATVDTPFLLASPTKPMTVSALMILRDRGDVALSDPVSRFLPRFTG